MSLASEMIRFPLCSLPIVAWLGCYGLCRELAARNAVPANRRFSWLLANLLWGTALTGLVEVASAVHRLEVRAVALGWGFIALLFWGAAARLASQRGASWRAWFRLRGTSSGGLLEWDSKLMLAASALLVLVLGLIAWLTPTTNYDSLTYHLPRIMHWMQNLSVAHYPTSDTRQLESAPWAAFALTNLHLLAGSDRLLNLPQWWSMLSCAIGASLLAEWLLCAEPMQDQPSSAPRTDPRRYAGLFAGLLVVTLPTGIVQSITTQNDYVVTMWLVSLVVMSFALLEKPRNLWLTLGVALSIALGMLTKATFVIYAAPLLLGFGLLFLVRRQGHSADRPFLLFRLAVAVGGVLLVLNGPHFLRNEAVFGDPLGSRYMFSLQRNEQLSLSGTASNLLRNLSLHTATGWEPLTRALNRGLAAAHRLTGRELNDPSLTFCAAAFSFQSGFTVSDNLTGDFHHAFILLCAVTTLVFLRIPGRRRLWFLVFLVAVSFLIFCGYLRWQAWHARFHLPYLVLLMPVAAVVAAVRWPRCLTGLLSLGLVVLAVTCVGWNQSRPLLDGGDFLFQPREQQYLAAVPDLYFPAVQVAEDLAASGCREIGLRVRHDFPRLLDEVEYPLWVLLRNRGSTARLHHVFFDNESMALAPRPTNLDAVVTSPGVQVPELTRALPHRVVHDPYAIHWTEAASRWAELTFYTQERRQALPRESPRVELTEGRLDLVLHSGRPGVLRVRGGLIFPGPPPVPLPRLFVKTDAGHVRLLPLDELTPPARLPSGNGKAGLSRPSPDASPGFDLEVPAPGGATPLRLELVAGPATGAAPFGIAPLAWSWEPSDAPLRWAFLTRLRAARGAGRSEAPTAFSLSRTPTILEIEAGADGQIELLTEIRFEATAPEKEMRTLLVTTHTGQSRTAGILAGQNLVAVPLVRGRNALGFTWPDARLTNESSRIAVTSLELRFP